MADTYFFLNGETTDRKSTKLQVGLVDTGDTMNGQPIYALRVDGGTSFPMLAPDGGDAVAPSYSFVSDPDTGMYRAGANSIGFSTAETNRLTISTAIASTVPFRGADGDATTPTYSFTSDPNTGIFSSAADTIGFSTGGTSRVTLSTSAFISTLPVTVGNGTTGTITLGDSSFTKASGGDFAFNSGVSAASGGINASGVFAGSTQAVARFGVDSTKPIALYTGSGFTIEVLRGSETGGAAQIAFLGGTPAVRQTGGAATAGAVYTATEQDMLQKAYDVLRTFNLLS